MTFPTLVNMTITMALVLRPVMHKLQLINELIKLVTFHTYVAENMLGAYDYIGGAAIDQYNI